MKKSYKQLTIYSIIIFLLTGISANFYYSKLTKNISKIEDKYFDLRVLDNFSKEIIAIHLYIEELREQKITKTDIKHVIKRINNTKIFLQYFPKLRLKEVKKLNQIKTYTLKFIKLVKERLHENNLVYDDIRNSLDLYSINIENIIRSIIQKYSIHTIQEIVLIKKNITFFFILLIFISLLIFIIAIYLIIRFQQNSNELKMNTELASISTFYAELAHDINNPLTIINTQLQNLKRKMTKENPNNIHLVQLDKTVVIIKYISKLVNSMRRMSRNKKEHGTAKINEIIQNATDLISLKVDKLNIKIINSIKNDSLVNGDQIQMGRVLINLFNNSIDELEKSSLLTQEKWIELRDNDHPDYYDLILIDSGNPIPQDLQEKIFDKFFTTKSEDKGTGLGLSSARENIENAKGQLLYKTIDNHPAFIMRFKKIVKA